MPMTSAVASAVPLIATICRRASAISAVETSVVWPRAGFAAKRVQKGIKQ
jgi:hypothetical protein